jgi:hypothetical protein
VRRRIIKTMDLREVITGAPKVTDQNLINPAKKSYGVSRTADWKAGILDGCSLLAALFFGYSYYRYLTDGLSPWYVFLAAILFCVASSIQIFVSKDLRRRALVLVGEAVACVAFFMGKDEWQIVVTAAGVSFIVLLWGYLSGRSRTKNSVEIHFFSSTGAVIGKVTTAMLLFMILVYIPQAASGAVIPQKSFETFFNWSSDFINRFYPNLSLQDSFGAFSASVAQMELAKNPTFAALTPAEQSAAVTQASNQFSSVVAQQTGSAPSPEEPVSDVAYNYLATSFVSWQNQFGSASIIIWVIILFLILRTIGVIFVWIAEFISLIFYEVLLASGFMHVSQVTQMKEVVEY